jgi:hypothetical protein
MGLPDLLLAAYLLVASWAMLMTWGEQRAKGQTDVLYNAAGLMACTLWPLVLLAAVLTPRR